MNSRGLFKVQELRGVHDSKRLDTSTLIHDETLALLNQNGPTQPPRGREGPFCAHVPPDRRRGQVLSPDIPARPS
jgi:hypothetical protein